MREESICEFFCNRNVIFIDVKVPEEYPELLPFILVDLPSFDLFLMRRNTEPSEPFKLLRMEVVWVEDARELASELGVEATEAYLVPLPIGLYLVFRTKDGYEGRLKEWGPESLRTYLRVA